MKWKQPSHRGLLLPALLTLVLAAPGWAANKTPAPNAGQASLTLSNCNSELCNANNTSWTLQKTPTTQSVNLPDNPPTISWTVTATRGATSHTFLSVFGVVTITNTGSANATLGKRAQGGGPADLETERASGPQAAGLDERLARLAERIARLWELEVELRCRLGERAIPSRLAHDLYRLVQEALVNAARHGRASRASVDLDGDGPAIRVSVADNGRGFPFQGEYDFATLTAAKLGPVSLKRRVAALGGRLDIASSAAGARIEVSLPQEPEG